VASGLRLLRHTRFDAIFSSSFPVTSHLIARRLAHSGGLPWLADFRDPWSEMLRADDPVRPRAARLERSLARAADAVVMTSPSWATLHARLWGRSVEVIPNGHDGMPIPANSPDAFTLAYLGSFYPDTQRLDGVWDALAALRRRGQLFVERIRVIGELNPQMRTELASRGLDDLLEVTGFVPHQEALRALGNSSALLVAGPAEANWILRGQVAAKLAEYLATDLPIVYSGDLACDAADLLRGYPGCHLVATGDVSEAIQALNASRTERVQRGGSALSRGALTERLVAILDRVRANGGLNGA
jgi:glycosyltransferase involved in cell wall biosynthesis